MKTEATKGFYTDDIFTFFEELENNNNKQFFDINRKRYEESIVIPSKTYVNAMSPFFNQLNPEIRTEPKFNHTLMRMNKDMRFTKGEPYRNYFLIHFGRFKLDSEFYLYFDKTGMSYGIFINKTEGEGLFFNKNLRRYREEIGEVFSSYKINGNYSFFELKKTPQKINEDFIFERDYNLLEKTKLVLFEKKIDKENHLFVSKGKDYSPELLNITTLSFLQLYPLYCFSISADPIMLLEKFEEDFGVD